MFYTDVLKKFLRTGTDPFGKQSLEMKWTQVNFFCYFIEIGLRLKIRPDVVYGLSYSMVIDGRSDSYDVLCAHKDDGSIV